MREIINLVEPFSTENFSEIDSGLHEYADDAIHAEVGLGDGGAIIHSLTSLEPGRGNGRTFVAWLKTRFGRVGVSDPGDPETSPEAFAFWSRLAEEGLVDEMEDDSGRIIFKDGVWR